MSSDENVELDVDLIHYDKPELMVNKPTPGSSKQVRIYIR